MERIRNDRRRTSGLGATLALTAAVTATFAPLGRAVARETPSALAGDAARTLTVNARSLRAVVSPAPWRLAFTDPSGGVVLAESTDRAGAGPGALGFLSAGAWAHATRAVAITQRSPGGALDALVETDDPDRRRLSVQLASDGDGVIAVHATVTGPASPADVAAERADPFLPAPLEAIGIAWDTAADERFFGLGERADRVEHRGATVESYVSDGPYQPDEFQLIEAILPKPGFRPRADATYFPIPWTLSSRGYGVLVDNDETVVHRLADAQSGADRWSFEVRGAPEDVDFRPAPSSLAFRVFAGPTPADALARFSRAVGRQPAPAAPWVFGPWYQPGGAVDEQIRQVQALRDADAPLSVAQTYLHYLPCGGDRSQEPARTAGLHALGVAVTTYFNPMLCVSYADAFRRAALASALVETASGDPYLYTYFTTRPFVVGQYDFSGAAGRKAFAERLADAVADGHDGWMEDFGEYTPLDAHTDDGRDGSASHNRYVVDYHCAANDFARRQRRPIVRFQRSGWTGAGRCAQVVWGGDPTTGWDFDGLASVVRGGLGLGLSGVSRFGSDIGGFFSFNGRMLTPELLTRWIELGAFSGVMRTERDGIAIPAVVRPQVDDPDQLPLWRRYTKLRTQLYPYVAAADDSYRRSGMPIMRHLVLAFPGDDAAAARDDEFLFGPDILAAPVLDPGATARELYLPAGAWIDLWRSARYSPADGSLALDRPRVLSGGAAVELPAPLEEIPLLVRLGALVPLLPPDVDTLAGYGGGELVRLDARGRARELIAFPHGSSSAALDRGARLASSESATGWQLAISGPVTRWRLQASLAALAQPFTPCSVEWQGGALSRSAWSYDAETAVLRASFTGGSGRLLVRRDCPATSPSAGAPPS